MNVKPEMGPGEMPRQEMLEILKKRAKLVEERLSSLAELLPNVPPRLRNAMAYSLEAGGKRIRPVLCLTCARLCGLEMEKALFFAVAIEMIHTYSLIHDDLPAMDDDDLRRGRPSNHKAFDEATAILAGDGLLTDAFYVMALSELPCQAVLAAMARIALAAGSSGMVGGQMLDMMMTDGPTTPLETGSEFGGKEAQISQLAVMQAKKTGAMLQASCECGAILAQAQPWQLASLAKYGADLGAAFQIADDILDITGDAAIMGKPAGSDEAQGKLTFPRLMGLAQSRALAEKYAENARRALDAFSGPDKNFLQALASYTVERTA